MAPSSVVLGALKGREMLRKLNERYDLPVIVAGLVVVIGLVALTIAMPETMLATLKGARDWVEYNLGSIIKLFMLAIIVCCVFFAVTKFGNIRFGKSKPRYSNWIWIILVFCSSFSMSIMFWAVVEWAEYVIYGGPTGLTVEETVNQTFNYLFMHWGIPVWCVLVIGVLPMGYNYYVRKKGALNVVDACAGVVGDNPNKVVAFIMNFIFVYGTVSALCISLGVGLPMLTHNLEPLAGIQASWTTTLIVAVVVTAVYTLSTVSGIDSGIKRFSKICTYLTIPVVLYIFIFGHPQFALDYTIQGIGTHLSDFFANILNIDPGQQGGGFPQGWTVYYFAWWISACPCYWIFTVKISQGRTFRSTVAVLFAAAGISTCFFFGSMTGTGVGDLILNNFDFNTLGSNGTIIDEFFNTGDEFAFVNNFLLQFPFGKVLLLVWFIASFFALTTMMDSSALVMAEATQRNMGVGKDSSKGLRVFWSIVIMLVPLVLLWAGADTTTMKCLLVISGIPVGVIVAMATVSMFKWAYQDFGHASAQEIREYFMTEEEKAELSARRQLWLENPLPEDEVQSVPVGEALGFKRGKQK